MCVMYGYARESSINTVRSKMLKKMVGEDDTITTKSKVDLVRLPPCHDSLIPHIQRVNHRVASYRHARVPVVERPKPFENNQGWIKNDDEIIEPMWSRGPILPTSLDDILETHEVEEQPIEMEIEEVDIDTDDDSDSE